MACVQQQVARVFVIALLASGPFCFAQSVPGRLRGGVPPQATAPAAPAFAPTPQPPSAVPAAPLSLLQEPAREPQIVFASGKLSIHAENASLTTILHQFAASSGMRITGLGSDERVFGTFGPGAPSDVLADLLNGTAYNQVLLGGLSNGAPRELILTPATRVGEAPPAPAAAPAAADDSVPDQDVSDVAPPPPPDVTPAQQTNPPAPGVRTPQQLFEQLQQMRQAQQQQINQQQDSPLQPPPQ